MLLHAECLPAQLAETAEQTVIAATFDGCDGNPLTPGVALAKCSDIPAPQGLSIVGQTLTLSGGGGSVTLPDSDDQTLTLVGNALSISGGNTVNLPAAPGQVAQVLSIVGNTVSLSGGGGSVTVPDDQQLSIAGNVISLTDGGSVTLPAASTPFATPAETIAGTSATLAVNPADLFARENIAAQTGLGLVLSAIPAPTASHSNWGVNTLGETLHYMPGVGWKIVADNANVAGSGVDVTHASSIATTFATISAPRSGKVTVNYRAIVSGIGTWQSQVYVNGIYRTSGNSIYEPITATVIRGESINMGTVALGDVITLAGFGSGGASFTVLGTTSMPSIDYTT